MKFFFQTKSPAVFAQYLSLALLLFGLKTNVFAADLKVAQEATGQETLKDAQGRGVVLELRHGPLGSTYMDFLQLGPRYSVTVYVNRGVVFNGESLVKTIGQASHTLSEQEFEEMQGVLGALELQHVKSQTGHGSYYATLKSSVRGIVYRIEFGNSNVEEYLRIRRSLERYLRTRSYRCPVDSSKDRGGLDVCADLFELHELLPEENRGPSGAAL